MPTKFIKSSQKIKDSKTKTSRCCYYKIVNGEANKNKKYIQKRVNGECKYILQKGGDRGSIFDLTEAQVKPRFSNLSKNHIYTIQEGNENDAEEKIINKRTNILNSKKAISKVDVF
jgi:hypothetical protein